MRQRLSGWLCFALFLLVVRSNSQTFFKQLNNPANSFKQKIDRFSGGDLLIADSSLEPLQIGAGGQIILTRIEQCGNVRWSHIYEREAEYLEFRDVRINAQNEIFIFGSAYQGLEELIFLLKVKATGELEHFRLFNTGTVDHSSLSLTLHPDGIMIYALLLDWDTQKQGVVAIFDDALQFQWGQKFAPFNSVGAAIVTQDAAFMCISGPLHVKLDARGQVEWAMTTDRTLAAPDPIGGPYELTDGFLFESFIDGNAFFYKLDQVGNLVWETAHFPSTGTPSGVQSIDGDGNMLVSYSIPVAGGNQLCQLMLSPSGTLSEHRQLMSDFSFSVGSISQSLGARNAVGLVANRDPFMPAQPENISNFFLHFTLNGGLEDCFSWQESMPVTTRNPVMAFQRVEIDLVPALMEEVVRGETSVREAEEPLFSDVCTGLSNEEVIALDTIIDCGTGWLVELPSAEFFWLDDHQGQSRYLEEPGTYSARSSNCDRQVLRTYRLDKTDCNCEVFIPSAFSPNGDGQNDTLEIFSNCTIGELMVRIFDRWGNLIYQTSNPEIDWNGFIQDRTMETGVYIVKVDYQLVSDNGGTQMGSAVRDVALIR